MPASSPLTPKDAAVLATSAVFRGLADDNLASLLSLAQEGALADGQILIKENFFSETVYVVLEGRLGVTLEQGHAGLMVATVGPGESVGEFCLLEDKERRCSATVRAASRARVARFSKPSLLAYFTSDPAAGYLVMTNLARLLIRRLENSNDLARSLVAADFSADT